MQRDIGLDHRPAARRRVTTPIASSPSLRHSSARTHRPLLISLLPSLLALLLVFGSLVTNPSQVSATFAEGSKYTSDSHPWVYLSKFCFDEAGGRVQFTMIEDLVSGAPTDTQMISFYADQPDSWAHVYGNSALSCQDKVDAAKRSYPISRLVETNYTYGYDVIGVIPRWWYIAVSNCKGSSTNGEAGLSISFWKIHFTNVTGIWSFEFSKDVQGILQMSIFFFVLYSCLLVVLAWIKNHAKQKNLQYHVTKYLFVSVLVEWVAMLFEMCHYAKFAHDGVGVPALDNSFFFFDFVSNLILLYVVLNISKGWAISTNFIPDRRISFVVISFLLLLYIALYIWIQEIIDPASVLYEYETPPGWTVVAVRSALTLWAIFCVVRTYRLESEHNRRVFYLVWVVFAAAWLVSLPIIVGVAHSIESWIRRRVVFGLTSSVQAAMFLVLTYIFRPFRSNRFVDIMKPDETRAFGTNNMQVFPSAGPVEFSNF